MHLHGTTILTCFRSRAFRGILSAGMLVLCSGCATRQTAQQSIRSLQALSQFYAQEASVSPMPASTPQFLDGGPAVQKQLLTLIGKAKDYILLDSFLLMEGNKSGTILNALVAARERNIRVYVIGDDSSRFIGGVPAFDFLLEHDIPTVSFHPFVPNGLLVWRTALERDHRKFWIIDGHTLVFGGLNVSDQSLMPAAEGGNRDLMVQLRSAEAARKMVISFVRTWNECEGKPQLDADDFTIPRSGRAHTSFWLFDQTPAFLPEGSSKEMFEGLLSAAQDEVWLIQPYTFVTPGITNKLRQLNRRGVKVNLLLSRKAHKPRFQYASHFGIPYLLDRGVQVWLYDSPTVPLHYKCTMVDRKFVAVGSANMNFRSYHLSREIGGVFQDEASVEAIERIVETLKNDSRPVTKLEAHRYRTPLHLMWWLLMLAGG